MAQEGQMQARGEFGRKFDVSEVLERPEGFTFVCPEIQQYTIQLQKDENLFVNGVVVKRPMKVASFVDYKFFTKDPEIAELVRKTSAFEKGRIKELRDAKADAAAAKKARVQALLNEDPEVLEALLREARPLGTAKSEAPVVETKGDAKAPKK